MEWICALDRQPENKGWYIVFAPRYFNASKEKIGGVMFSKWNGKSWSIDAGNINHPSFVDYWMQIIQPNGYARKYKIIKQGKKLPLVIRFETEQDFLDSTRHYSYFTEEAKDDSGKLLETFLKGHDHLVIFSECFSRWADVPIFVCENMTFPQVYKLGATRTGHNYYFPYGDCYNE